MADATLCVHAGTFSDPGFGEANSPIHPSTAYEYLDTEARTYPRYFNTFNQERVVEKLCALERTEAGIVFSSGMAAVSTVFLAFLRSGDHAVIQEEIYGGSHHFVTGQLQRFGIDYTLVSTRSSDLIAAINPRTRLIYIETPTNPLLSIVDIDAVAALAREKSILSVIDNTFATPINQKPHTRGIDVVLHSGTKYLGGHSDLCCGAVLTTALLKETIIHTARSLGGSLNALDCHLLERSLKTLSLRVHKQNDNALFLAKKLLEAPGISNIHYPGLPDHPQHETAVRQMAGFGGMLSFELNPGLSPIVFMKRLRLIRPVMSLGGVESTICDPLSTSHAEVGSSDRERLGIKNTLLRLSVGIEDAQDLFDDILQALNPD